MAEERAINLYYYLVNNKAPKRELDVVINLLKQQYKIDLSHLERKTPPPKSIRY
ncbi:hypothetical protein ACQKPX_12665 [Photobacterium sp. DNB23_23_1]|uniref:Uncharacterized protein n=1 Tax=Photobacterium pectinilyticum TaxID=2906793 RepID=A0ABT1N8X8_9GAMM|nr:hypothetical protein [Photobacterium sp. ZSDE20]MCQ1061205.1 hypothetical protein [Photobacterium sp. ZSDE20]MDD1829586.1 hypothetical protein [Photobacterium sp. ZSDE20]